MELEGRGEFRRHHFGGTAGESGQIAPRTQGGSLAGFRKAVRELKRNLLNSEAARLSQWRAGKKNSQAKQRQNAKCLFIFLFAGGFHGK
jgi:hypothetical protein